MMGQVVWYYSSDWCNSSDSSDCRDSDWYDSNSSYWCDSNDQCDRTVVTGEYVLTDTTVVTDMTDATVVTDGAVVTDVTVLTDMTVVTDVTHSCQLCKKRTQDKVLMRAKILDHTHFWAVTPTILAPAPRFQPPRPLNIEIYGPKPVWYTKFMLEPHPHLCNWAVFRDTATKSGNPGHNRDIGPNSGTVPDILGELATMDVMVTDGAVRSHWCGSSEW